MDKSTPEGNASPNATHDRATTKGAMQLELDLVKPTPLPTSVSGLQTFYSEVVQYLLAAKYELTFPIASATDMVDHGERRLPAVFAPNSKARGPAIAAIGCAEDLIRTLDLPAESMTWPLNPLLLAELVRDITTPLVDSLAALQIDLPGSVDDRHRRALERTPVVRDNRGSDDQPYHARTGFLPDPHSDRDVQYTLDRRDHIIVLHTRHRGDRGFKRCGELRHDHVVGIIALLRHYREVFGLTG